MFRPRRPVISVSFPSSFVHRDPLLPDHRRGGPVVLLRHLPEPRVLQRVHRTDPAERVVDEYLL